MPVRPNWLDILGNQLAVRSGGVAVPVRQYLDFEGIGVVVTDDETNDQTVVTVSGGGSGFTAAGDLGGTSTSQTVVGLRGRPVAATAPSMGQFLSWSGSAWAPATVTIPSTLPPSGSASGDLSGSYPGPTVAALQGRPMSSAAPGSGNVIAWNGSAWAPAAAAASFTAAGDLSGTSSSQTVVGLQGVTVSAVAPITNYVLKFNGISWGSAPLPTALPPNGAASGDLAGSYPSPTVAKLQGFAVASTTPTTNYVLTWNGSSWSPAPTAGTFTAAGDLSGSSSSQTVVALQGRSVSATAPTGTFTQYLGWSGSAWTPSTITIPTTLPPSGTAGGDLSGSYPNPTVSKIQSVPVTAVAPTDQQSIIYQASTGLWTPAFQNRTTPFDAQHTYAWSLSQSSLGALLPNEGSGPGATLAAVYTNNVAGTPNPMAYGAVSPFGNCAVFWRPQSANTGQIWLSKHPTIDVCHHV